MYKNLSEMAGWRQTALATTYTNRQALYGETAYNPKRIEMLQLIIPVWTVLLEAAAYLYTTSFSYGCVE